MASPSLLVPSDAGGGTVTKSRVSLPGDPVPDRGRAPGAALPGVDNRRTKPAAQKAGTAAAAPASPQLGRTSPAPGMSQAKKAQQLTTELDLTPGHPRDLPRTAKRWEGRGALAGRLLPMPPRSMLSPDGVYLPIVDELGNGWWLLVGEGSGGGGRPVVDLGALWQPLVFGPTRPNPNDAREALDIPSTAINRANLGMFADLNALSLLDWHRFWAWRALGFATDERPLDQVRLSSLLMWRQAGDAIGGRLQSITAGPWFGPEDVQPTQAPIHLGNHVGRAQYPLTYGAISAEGDRYFSSAHVVWESTEYAGATGLVGELVDACTKAPQEAGITWAQLKDRCSLVHQIPIKFVPMPGTNFDGSYYAVGCAWSRIAVLVSRNTAKWPSSTLPTAPGKVKAQFDELRTVEIVKESFAAVGGAVQGILTWNFGGLVDALTNAVNGPVLQQLRLKETSLAAQADTVRATAQAAIVKTMELALLGPKKPIAGKVEDREAPNVWMSAPGALGVEPGAVWVWGEWREAGGPPTVRWVKITGLDGSPYQVAVIGGQLRYRGTPAWIKGGASFGDIDPAWVVGIPGGPFSGVRYLDRNKPRTSPGLSPLTLALLGGGALLLLL